MPPRNPGISSARASRAYETALNPTAAFASDRMMPPEDVAAAQLPPAEQSEATFPAKPFNMGRLTVRTTYYGFAELPDGTKETIAYRGDGKPIEEATQP